jgi:hypothetical protein
MLPDAPLIATMYLDIITSCIPRQPKCKNRHAYIPVHIEKRRIQPVKVSAAQEQMLIH